MLGLKSNMLVYTTLFTLANKNPKENKYITMFYMWFSYLKRYSGLGPNDSVGLIVDEDTFGHMDSDGNQIFSYISERVPFRVEISIMKRPANLSEGLSERYNMTHFNTFTHKELNLYLDIDCLCIRNIHKLFDNYTPNGNTIYVMPENGTIDDDDHGGEFVRSSNLPYGDIPAFTSAWIAWNHSEKQKDIFNTVLKDCRERYETPLYTVDQPFYNREIFLALNKNIHIVEQDILLYNPYIPDKRLKDAYFVNFAGEPGVEDCHFVKMFGFMCMDFSIPSVPLVLQTPTFHILIATVGRPSLKKLLDSLKDELTEKDAITIVFDGMGKKEKSGYDDSWFSEHLCKYTVLVQEPNLGAGIGGEPIRTKYQTLLSSQTTYIMHADDDDEYIAGSFEKLRKLCVDPEVLYIAKMTYADDPSLAIPRQNKEIVFADIGTPNGIIPFHSAGTAEWGMFYGGDYYYYNGLQDNVKDVVFLDEIIYMVSRVIQPLPPQEQPPQEQKQELHDLPQATSADPLGSSHSHTE